MHNFCCIFKILIANRTPYLSVSLIFHPKNSFVAETHLPQALEVKTHPILHVLLPVGVKLIIVDARLCLVSISHVEPQCLPSWSATVAAGHTEKKRSHMRDGGGDHPNFARTLWLCQADGRASLPLPSTFQFHWRKDAMTAVCGSCLRKMIKPDRLGATAFINRAH